MGELCKADTSSYVNSGYIYIYMCMCVCVCVCVCEYVV